MLPFTRRSFLAGLTIQVFGGALSTTRSQDSHSPAHEGSWKNAASQDAVRTALRTPSRKLRGFDPARFASSFDWGSVTVRPNGRVLREYTLRAVDSELEVAPGVMFPAWGFNGTVPGPTLRCREGDRVRVRFINDSIAEHTIHFHGIHPATMDGVGPMVEPGSEYVYEFDAEPFGMHLYHCHVAPLHLHMSRGLFGALVIDPVEARSEAREMVLITHGWDINFDGTNELYAINGPANFYRDNPIVLRAGELVRLYLANVLEFDPVTSFHLHANMFDVFHTGTSVKPHWTTDIITLAQAERFILEFRYRYPGTYMFHAHQSAQAEGGMMGHFQVV